MSPAQELQQFIVKRLHAKVKSVESHGGQFLEKRSIQISRIDFDGDLGPGLQVKMTAHPFHDFPQLRGSQKRRSSPAEVYGIKGPKGVADDRYFLGERLEKIRDKGERSAGREGAIGALFNTKGDMDVEPGSGRGILGWIGF